MKTEKKRNARKILLVLPMLALPFLALGFYALGGGNGNGQEKLTARGINTTLPDAKLKEKVPEGKMDFYAVMQADSARKSRSENYAGEVMGHAPAEKQAKELEDKLAALQKTLAAPAAEPKAVEGSRVLAVPGMKGDVDRLELLMKSMQEKKTEDPEVTQLNAMLEKIIEIQNPVKVKDNEPAEKAKESEKLFSAIPALIAEKQKVREGAVLKLILLDSTILSSVMVPAGHELFGLCKVTNQRLLVDIKTVRLGKMILPVDLSLYGLDGIRGIETGEPVVAQSASGGADDAVRGLQLLGMDQSIGTQLAGAGIDAAKGLVSRKVRSVRVRIPGGIQVLLRDNGKK
ncbi:conjugal transfer protein TraM [Pedobacter sp. KBW01]|uniref:conjugative transposon protein TraM n=1 Tax=Pedobacter sp. KBW01 TaxID=2153364 RepID=UPI000F5A1794|nr:conjugative transposon protein TraM [Pedobacter sp. KBW01]RQO77729.1 conjugal transfer protein TraM [Pedobacter sp. KBW01]